MWSKIRRRGLQSAPTLILALFIVVLLSAELWRSYLAARQDGERTVFNLVHVLSEQAARTVQSIDLNIQDIVKELADNPSLPVNSADFRAELHNRLSTLPYVRAIFVIGPDGYITHDTDYPTTPHVSLADRAYFKAHAQDPSPALHIGPPLKSRSVGVWFISLTRRIEGKDGRFAGVVVAAMEPRYFKEFYQKLWVGGGTIALLLADGTLLTRSPNDEEVVGKSFADAEPFKSLLAQGNRGVLWSDSPIDGVKRVVGYQRLDSAPLVMLATLNEDDVMEPWRSHAMIETAGAGILLLLLATLEWLAWRYRRREELARQRLERTQRLESIGRFAGGVAHDLGNLLRVIRSSVLLLRPTVSDRPEALGVLDELDVSLASGRELVNQLLSYARDRQFQAEATDLGLLIDDVLPMLRQAAGPRISLVKTFADAVAVCVLDGTQFRAAMVNLVLNARDAMPAGGTIFIDLRLVGEQKAGDIPHWAEVTVRDEGTGMSEHVRRQAFDPFFTTKGQGLGNGLGLNQVYDFIERCGGQVELFSEEGKGTSLKLRFPLSAPGGASDAGTSSLQYSAKAGDFT
ncbi:hybrid sensor histidine kinase/response regulator [Rhizobium multihospitium]|uniref:histidine kinase n=1 Tax=Rhizobium multihospitium TaxID=410764 RepID=A0A1C3VWH3_9HYPH|nr:hybrid sensor histidine kinase/response regulator [Rhizobium multihospitium]SCB32006.1 Histidine kinase-, DNA gyrase B-, and HSP90-like ATPase [Rhizobium multihospitium]